MNVIMHYCLIIFIFSCANLIACYANISNPTQLSAVLCVLMEVHVWPLSSAPVWRGGLGAAVTLVSTLHVQSMWSIHMTTPLPPSPAAVCSIPCLNGGHCSAPDRCTCSTGWEGQSCSARKGEGLRGIDRPSPLMLP